MFSWQLKNTFNIFSKEHFFFLYSWLFFIVLEHKYKTPEPSEVVLVQCSWIKCPNYIVCMETLQFNAENPILCFNCQDINLQVAGLQAQRLKFETPILEVFDFLTRSSDIQQFLRCRKVFHISKVYVVCAAIFNVKKCQSLLVCIQTLFFINYKKTDCEH